MHRSRNAFTGTWVIAEDDVIGSSAYGCISMKFDEASSLIYTIHAESRDEIILMIYQVEGDVLITDQPSAPRVERTKFRFDGEDCLILEYDDDSAQDVRLHRRLP